MATIARKGLSKRTRFEVFKRDSFQCQYCGRKAPDVVLHIDHIEPVAKGGKNEILNLITSCYECNLGKSDKKLSDGSAVEKQRKQLELLEEKREQMKLMVEWKKSLSKLDDKTLEIVRKHIEEKIRPYNLNENGQNTLRLLLRKYPLEKILDAVNISALQYLKFTAEGELQKDSVENFVNKLGGILFNQNLKPIDQKIAFIKNRAKTNLNYFDPRKASILLNQYVSALRDYWKYTDEQIVKDLETELLPKTEESGNWSSWKNLIESWIESIKKPKEEKAEDDFSWLVDFKPDVHTPEKLEAYIQGRKQDLDATVKVLVHILTPYPNFNEKKFTKALYSGLLQFVEETGASDEQIKKYEDQQVRNGLIWEIAYDDLMVGFLEYDPMAENIDGWFLDKLYSLYESLVEKVFEQFHFSASLFTPEDAEEMRKLSLAHIKKLVAQK